MSKALRLSEKWFHRGLWLVALVFAVMGAWGRWWLAWWWPRLCCCTTLPPRCCATCAWMVNCARVACVEQRLTDGLRRA